MDKQLEEIIKRLDMYERRLRRLALLSFYVLSLLLTYKYAYKRGSTDTLQLVVDTLEQSKGQRESYKSQGVDYDPCEDIYGDDAEVVKGVVNL